LCLKPQGLKVVARVAVLLRLREASAIGGALIPVALDPIVVPIVYRVPMPVV
jgi:hypothetical protein